MFIELLLFLDCTNFCRLLSSLKSIRRFHRASITIRAIVCGFTDEPTLNIEKLCFIENNSKPQQLTFKNVGKVYFWPTYQKWLISSFIHRFYNIIQSFTNQLFYCCVYILSETILIKLLTRRWNLSGIFRSFLLDLNLG